MSEWRASDSPESGRTVYADNAQPHIARLSIEFFEDNQMKTATRPLYSHDIAPSFGYVKGCLAGRSFVDAEELCEAVRWVPESTEKVTLQAAFLEWIDRLRKCTQTNNQYTE
jgi:hypothetical protein